MTIPTTSLDETSPAGDQKLNLGDNRIREYKIQNREILEVDHVYPSTGQDADAGKHNQVSLIEQADIGSGATGKPILGAQTYGGKPELAFTDEDDNDILLTSAGKMGHSTTTGVVDDLEVLGDLTLSTAAKATLMGLIYPIGSVVTLGVTTNPGTLYGVGTWTQIKGRVIVGIADSGTFDTLDATMGAETHTLSTDEIPAHTHSIATGPAATSSPDNDKVGGSASAASNTASTGSAGGGSAHNNIQPTIVKYIWERTA